MGRTLAAAIGIASIAAAAVASAEPPAGAASCSGCHPAPTRMTAPVPRLAGLDRAALVRAMQGFRSGSRAAPGMDRIAQGFPDDEVHNNSAQRGQALAA